MPLFTRRIQKRIEFYINRADTLIRTDFNKGYVVDENGYTDLLTAEIRRHINRYLPVKAITISQRVPGTVEQKWGVDACIILVDHDRGEGKICLFEAKVIKKGWDYPQQNSNPQVSHFSTQLYRQRTPHRMGYAVWEQFYSKLPSRASFFGTNRLGSSCIYHDNAISHNATHPHPNANVWTNADIINLCSLQRGQGEPITMGGVVRRVCECSKGTSKTIDEINIFIKENLSIQYMLFIEGGEQTLKNREFKTIGEYFKEKNEN